MTPLDGQQRLTTLYLLHWYAAKKDNVPADETAFLKNFSYEIRPEARDFCKCLVEFSPSFNETTLSAEIENQAWFPLNWLKDPTIDSMLRMLDAIAEKFCNVPNLWAELEGGAIYFNFLSIKDIGLTDELYITMNSRGKPLTDFEHFKAEFKRKLDELDTNISDRIIFNIDTKWTDLLWKFCGEDKLIDDMFLNYFRFICDILRYKRGGTSQGKSYDEFILLEEFFSSGNVRDNIDFLEKSFDYWCGVDIDKFFDERVSLGDRAKRGVNQHQRSKIIVYFEEKNIFKNCLKSYGRTDSGSRKFSLPKTILLYAFLMYRLNCKNISDSEFRRRIRIVNNLINNTETDISDSENRQSGNRLPAVLKQIDSIICNGIVRDLPGQPNFNSYQISEERKKLEWTAQNPALAESLFELEDNDLLYGQIAILGLENQRYFKSFISLFKCDYDKINCALVTLGDYCQSDKAGVRFQFGMQRPQSWQNLFHKSSYRLGFDSTQENLLKLLERTDNFTDAFLDKIIADYLADCERRKSFEWSYYYIKYPIFRPNRYGKYDWRDFKNKPYQLVALLTNKRRTENVYQPFLKAVTDDEIFFEDHYNSYYERIEFENRYCVICENAAYIIKDFTIDDVIDTLPINQNSFGVDTEDRIKKFLHWQGKDLLNWQDAYTRVGRATDFFNGD